MSHATPLAGDKPQPYIFPSTLGCNCSGHGGWCCRPVPESIPDRSPGHAFVPGSEFPAGDHLLNGGAHGPGLVAGFGQLLSKVGFTDPAVEVSGGQMIAG